MKFVIYYDTFGMSVQNGFIISETETTYHLVIPMVYEWLSRLNQLDKIYEMKTYSLEKDYFKPVEYRYSSKFDDWVFEFSIEHRTKEEFYEICRYFEHQQYYKKEEPIKMLEKSVDTLGPVLDRKTVKKLMEFTITKMNLEQFRVKNTLSSVINRSLYQKRKGEKK